MSDEPTTARGCLMITRKTGEKFFIDEDVEIRIMSVIGGKVKIEVRAPKSVVITRDYPPSWRSGHRDAATDAAKQANLDVVARLMGKG